MIPAQIAIGPVEFHLYGAIIAIAILTGWYLAKRRANLYQIPQKIFDDWILLIPMVLALIGARIYHVVDYWRIYSQIPISILYVWGGGLGIWGGIAGAVLGLWIAANIKKLNVLSVLDLAAPSILLGQAIGRIGNYINQEGFGPPTNLPWGVYISPDKRPDQYVNFSHFHPTFFYEAVINIIFFVLLIYLERKFVSNVKGLPRTESVLVRGQVFSLYLIFYSVSRFISEFWRIDTATVNALKIAHVISLIVFIAGIILFISLRHRARLDRN